MDLRYFITEFLVKNSWIPRGNILKFNVSYIYVNLWLHFGEGNGNPLQCSCLENPTDGGARWAAIYGVAQGRTRLKWLEVAAAWLHLYTYFFSYIQAMNILSDQFMFWYLILVFKWLYCNTCLYKSYEQIKGFCKWCIDCNYSCVIFKC